MAFQSPCQTQLATQAMAQSSCLSAEEMAEVTERFRGYRQPRRGGSLIRRWLWALAGCLCAALSWAQGTADADRDALRRSATEPVPAVASDADLRQHFDRQSRAANRLADLDLREQILREAMRRLPRDSRWPNDLAWMLAGRGQADDARKLFESAMALAPTEADRQFYACNRHAQLVILRSPDAQAAADDIKRKASALLARETLDNVERITSMRALGCTLTNEARAHEQQGRLIVALAAYVEGERSTRAAYQATREFRQAHDNLRFVVATDYAASQRDRATLLLRLGRQGEAAALLEEHLAFVQQNSLPGTMAPLALRALAFLHRQRGQWAESERHLRRAIELLDAARVARTHPLQLGLQQNLLTALWASGRLDEARRELDALDALRTSQRLPPSRLQLPFERGLVDLAQGRAAEAAALFAKLADDNQQLYGAGAFYTAQARGLQASALWASGAEAERDTASDLLKDAVLDMLAPRNADLFDDNAIRRPVRELIFRSYLEAAAWRGGLQAMVAMGVADRLATTGAARAVADAAVRASASDPALAELVRKEQDLRRQIDALRSEGSAVNASADAPVRRRWADLELQRQQAQDQIRTRFPEYDRLLHPPLANPTEVAQRLRRNEVLLLAVPTERALYLWAVNADDLPAFARVEVTAKHLARLVDRVRGGVDFDRNGGRPGRFDHAAARELHRLVLAPVAARLQGRQHLIVAASGALAQLPLAMLPEGDGADPSWLVRRLAVSQVPSLSAWLSLRQGQAQRSTPLPLLAWADPAFAMTQPAAATQRGELGYESLTPLPESRDEAHAVARALKADPERDVLVGQKATRDSVLDANRSGRLGQARVVMFATHGLSAGELPGVQQPGLALSALPGPADPSRFVVGLDDVLSLRLNADWVVLSACNTAGGDGRAEEALSGLARGFLYAGARSLLVTHWAVETESARQLTTRLFEYQAAQPQAARAESLRQAMLALMAQPAYAHPAFWAPFALVGEGLR